jgi:hypothetical protein
MPAIQSLTTSATPEPATPAAAIEHGRSGDEPMLRGGTVCPSLHVGRLSPADIQALDRAAASIRLRE